MPCPIQLASKLSGLSQHVIRIWERRYSALSPTRTGTNRRMYCDEAVKRLKLLKILTENGHRIGGVARLGTAELEDLAKGVQAIPADPKMPVPVDDLVKQTQLEEPEKYIDAAIAASKRYDCEGLRRVLLQARLHLGQRGMLHQVICPLLIQIGNSWRSGQLRASHEHIATAVIREILLTPVPGCQIPVHAPELVVATPSGEPHELGALIVAASARELGWYVTYLGPSLAVEEIAACAIARHATAVALSVVFPDKCPLILEKLGRMRELLPPTMRLIVGGRAAEGYRESLPSDIAIQWVSCLHGLDDALCKNQR
jgi:DNA-binding transcriptional MerR regulator/methylmalonyl-CoA mutase cobalamin-binding subunit